MEKTKIVLAIVLCSLCLPLSSVVLAQAQAAKPFTKFILNKTTTESLGGTWDSTTSTCTFTTTSIGLYAGQVLVIPAGTTLAISNYGSFPNDGTVNNAGTIMIDNQVSIGFGNTGTVKNDGTITISNDGRGSLGFQNLGTLKNDGTIAISNAGTSTTGFRNDGTITNDGTIMVSPSANGVVRPGYVLLSYGFDNRGMVKNDGTITISNTGSYSYGFDNRGTVKNDGAITISNSGTANVGFYNDFSPGLYFGTVENDGTISTCGSGGDGFYSKPGSTYEGNPVVTSC